MRFSLFWVKPSHKDYSRNSPHLFFYSFLGVVNIVELQLKISITGFKTTICVVLKVVSSVLKVGRVGVEPTRGIISRDSKSLYLC